jgi:hypothetical protein
MATVVVHKYVDGDTSLEYPECRYFGKNEECWHEDSKYIYCSTHHVVGMECDCPFDVHKEISGEV